MSEMYVLQEEHKSMFDPQGKSKEEIAKHLDKLKWEMVSIGEDILGATTKDEFILISQFINSRIDECKLIQLVDPLANSLIDEYELTKKVIWEKEPFSK